MDKVGTKYCILENDGVSLCVCKHRPCEQLQRLQHYQAEFEHELMNDYTYDGYISPNGFTPIDVIKHIKSELKRLEQENERLKEECTLYDCGNKEWAIEYKKLEDDYTELIDRLDDISYDKSNYYQALQEIRDICKNSHTSASEDYYRTADKIQDKINEVIGAE